MAIDARRIVLLIAGTVLVGGLNDVARADSPNLDLSFLKAGGADLGGVGVSVGSIGLDSKAGTSRWVASDPDPYRFVIPADQSARKAPGFLFKIPFGAP